MESSGGELPCQGQLTYKPVQQPQTQKPEEKRITKHFCGLFELVHKSPDHTNTTVIARKVTKPNPHAAIASFLT